MPPGRACPGLVCQASPPSPPATPVPSPCPQPSEACTCQDPLTQGLAQPWAEHMAGSSLPRPPGSWQSHASQHQGRNVWASVRGTPAHPRSRPPPARPLPATPTTGHIKQAARGLPGTLQGQGSGSTQVPWGAGTSGWRGSSRRGSEQPGSHGATHHLSCSHLPRVGPTPCRAPFIWNPDS